MANDATNQWRSQWRSEAQEKRAKELPRTPGKGVVLIREPEESKSLCIEHSREAREYAPNEDRLYAQGEELGGEERKGRGFRGRASSLDRVRTKLIEARAEVELYEAQEEELWKELHPVCRTGVGDWWNCAGATTRDTTTGARRTGRFAT